jgi:hypothetical protein
MEITSNPEMIGRMVRRKTRDEFLLIIGVSPMYNLVYIGETIYELKDANKMYDLVPEGDDEKE